MLRTQLFARARGIRLVVARSRHLNALAGEEFREDHARPASAARNERGRGGKNKRLPRSGGHGVTGLHSHRPYWHPMRYSQRKTFSPPALRPPFCKAQSFGASVPPQKTRGRRRVSTSLVYGSASSPSSPIFGDCTLTNWLSLCCPYDSTTPCARPRCCSTGSSTCVSSDT